MKKICLLSLMIGALVTAFSQKEDYVITTYGARPDGVTNNVAAIQRAIDDASKAGGGRVLIPRGRYVSGVIRMKSNVELNVHEEAVLLATFNRADYGPSLQASAFIVADNEKNIAITGKGLIDGQSDLLINDLYLKLRSGEMFDDEWKDYNPWHQRRPSEKNRPRLIEFKNCDGVRMKNIHLQNAAAWVQNFKECNNVEIDSEHVFSNTFWNNDGIDLVDCKNARVTNCVINVADDGICLKSENRNSYCENIYVANCKIRSSASAVKFGTASYGGFKKIVIKDIEVYDTYRSAIAIEVVDGGIVDDVQVSNIRAVNTGNAIFIRLGHRNKDAVYSQLRNVRISDIKVVVPAGKPDKGYTMEGPELKYPSTYKADTSKKYESVSPWNNSGIDSSAVPFPHNIFPSSITGIPGHVVENVRLENIEIIYQGGASKGVSYFPIDSIKSITEAETSYPEFSMFGELPAWGFYARHVKGLTMNNITLRAEKNDFRASMIFNDVQGFSLKRIEIPLSYSSPVILLYDVPKPVLQQIEIPGAKTGSVITVNAH